MILLLFTLLFTSLWAESPNPIVRTTRSWTDCVNIATGEFCLHESDLRVPGIDPLAFNRFYNHRAPKNERLGLWRYNPESYCVANFEFPGSPRFFSIGSRDGSIDCLEESAPGIYTFDPRQPCFFNLGQAASHPHNLRMFYNKEVDPKNSDRMNYIGQVIDGGGATRSFSSGFHTWLKATREKVKWRIEDYIHYFPETWTPFHLSIDRERRPNGNVVCYSYTWNQKHDYYPTYPELKSITLFNRDQSAVIGQLEWNYQTKTDKQKGMWIKQVIVKGGDQSTHLSHEGREVKTLTEVKRERAPPVEYRYDDKHRLSLILFPEGRTTQIIYDDRDRVKTIQGPYGEKASYDYFLPTNSTQVTDGAGRVTTYCFDSYKRVSSVKRGKRVDHYQWETNSGNLTSHKVCDQEGHLFKQTTYKYDAYHNVIEEREGERIKRWAYSDDERHLLIWERSPLGLETEYTYLPQTNLVIRTLTKYQGKILKRRFCDYDLAGGLVQEILDDGSTKIKEDLTDVKTRKIRVLTPKTSLPCYGLPVKIEEKTIDDLGNEYSLGWKEIKYSSAGDVTEERLFGSDGSFKGGWRYEYQNGCLTKQIDPAGNVTTKLYDKNHNCILEQGPTTYTETRYDLENRPLTVIKDGKMIEEREYNLEGELIATTDRSGFVTHYYYDDQGNLSTIIYPDGGILKRRYNPLGHLIAEEDPRGDLTQWTRDPEGHPLTMIHPDGSEERWSYDLEGKEISHTNRHGATLHTTYDPLGGIISRRLESGGKVWKTWHIKRTPFVVLEEIEPSHLVTNFTYDQAGRLLRKQCGEEVESYTYDPYGRKVATFKDDLVVYTCYDPLDRVIMEREQSIHGTILSTCYTDYDGAGNPIRIEKNGVEKRTYDGENRLLSVTDPMGQVTTWSYDFNQSFTLTETSSQGVKKVTKHHSRGWPISIEWFDQQEQTLHLRKMSYDQGGLLVAQTDQSYFKGFPRQALTTEWELGPGGRVISELRNHRQKWTHLYDSKGRESQLIKPDMTRFSSQYDPIGRLHRFSGPDFDYIYTYDTSDHIISAIDQITGQKTLSTYDKAGNLTHELLANGLEISHQYDPYRRRIQTSIPGHSPIDYTYLSGRLSHIRFDDLTFTYLERNGEGQPSHLLLPQGMGRVSATRDLLGRVTQLTTPFEQTTLTYDLASNITSCRSRGLSHFYEYDELGQLIQEDDHHFGFDSVGTCLNDDNTTFLYNEMGARLSDGVHRYEYDANGNLLTDGRWLFEYDSLDRLIRVVTEEGESQYQYDPSHRRITAIENGQKISYLWDGTEEIGSPEKGEFRLIGEGLCGHPNITLLMKLKGKRYVAISDYRGSIAMLVDLATQKPSELLSYSAFSEDSHSTAISPWRFGGKREDQLTHLIYFGRRYYHPSLLHWLTPDPCGIKISPNPYAFVHNNPLLLTDPHGLWARNIIDCFRLCLQPIFYGIEMTGRHLLPVPGIKDLVEAFGRWGQGGTFNAPCYHQVNYNRMQMVPGTRTPGKTEVYTNGINTTFEEALVNAKRLSNSLNGQEVMLLYNGTHGFMMDVLETIIAKIGIITPVERMNADYFKQTLARDSHHTFNVSAHSQAGTHMVNVATLLKRSERMSISLSTFGSPSIVSKHTYGSVHNYINVFDPVPLASPLAYIGALFFKQSHISLIPPKSFCPFLEHGLLSSSYHSYIK